MQNRHFSHEVNIGSLTNGRGGLKKWFRWSWCVFGNFLYVTVVLYIFSKIQERNLTIILALIGLVFVAIRQTHLSRFLETGPLLINLSKKIDRLHLPTERKSAVMVAGRMVFGDKSEEPDLVEEDTVQELEGELDLIEETAVQELEMAYSALEAELQVNTVKIYISSGFLAVISLICLFQLFTAL
jgi:hypothetical protein